MTVLSLGERVDKKRRRCGWSNGGDPTHHKLRDGWGTRVFVAGRGERATASAKAMRVCRSFSANSLCLRFARRSSYLDAFFFFAAVFFAAFFFDFFEALGAVPGLTTVISFVPMGVPRPVQASQPGPALKPTGVPV